MSLVPLSYPKNKNKRERETIVLSQVINSNFMSERERELTLETNPKPSSLNLFSVEKLFVVAKMLQS